RPDTIRIPPYLRKGDTVAIIAPAGYVTNKNGYIDRADSLLRAWGLVPVHGRHLFKRHFQFAGTDAERAADLQWALDDPSVKAIWAARGGYGSVRLLDRIDWSTFRRRPKWIIGYSDITVLEMQAYALGVASIHGLMPISLTHPRKERRPALVTLKNVIFGRKLKFAIPSDSLNIPGTGEGIVVGGNLSILVSLLGSDLQLNTDGKILFLEDVGEYPYRYDRMLYALARAGYFDNLAGLIVGNMHTRKDNEPFGESVKEMILKHVKGKGYPVIFDFPAGHVVKNYTVPIGKTGKITVTSKKAVIEFR
ncbi:MAG: LD-carboxypeptidase, partial [Chlorobi bacterium]|nr:LD-carboxypeptidase [Chlorobiota bacterium]